ncbi:hypothetical protein B9Z19DRAFT_1085744 [Tuber borchii]|uniref:Uncharacterized protein n=1 Tax=Tuber borchii TaxID=42251 RepID=A0A2T6ZQD6_TUBBO|nr:hypothetical protein B9Z19DRAFT_1085744 [Tuber borchii]
MGLYLSGVGFGLRFLWLCVGVFCRGVMAVLRGQLKVLSCNYGHLELMGFCIRGRLALAALVFFSFHFLVSLDLGGEQGREWGERVLLDISLLGALRCEGR